MAAHIDKMQVRHRRIAETRMQVNGVITSRTAVDLTFHRRRGRDQHDRELGDPRPDDGHIACIIKDAVFLLVGRVVLFIDNDETEIVERQEKRRTRTGHHLHFTSDGLPPDLFTHAR
ncbi:hypothetical protein D3C86_1120100 [compost metagenome]